MQFDVDVSVRLPRSAPSAVGASYPMLKISQMGFSGAVGGNADTGRKQAKARASHRIIRLAASI